MASTPFLYHRVTCPEVATPPATSPVGDTNSSSNLNSHLDLKCPKTDCGFRSHAQKLLHLTSRAICNIPLQTLTQILKTNVQKFLGEQVPGSSSRPRLHVQHRHISKPGSEHPCSSSGWPAGNLAFAPSSALPGLLCPCSASSKSCFCPLKNTESDLGGAREERPARERLSRGTKFTCPSFSRSLALGLPY